MPYSNRCAAPRRLRFMLLAAALCFGATPSAHADMLGHATAAYNRGDYIHAARDLSLLAEQGNPRALGLLGFLYEHGYGVPQSYDAAADCYGRGAVQGNPFAQAMLGLMYDKGHGLPQDFILAYKWLDLAAAHTRGHERDTYARFRDAVASKMSKNEIAVGQRLALSWTASVVAPPVFESASRVPVYK
jgi:TPR repeat protein